MIAHALLRRPASSAADGLTTAEEGRPDLERTRRQFDAYALALADAGVALTILDPLPAHPDAHFVEDVAVVVPGAVVLTRPGAPSRRGEVEAIAPILRERHEVVAIEAPGTLDGGDVLLVGDTAFVGHSSRTNEAGIEQFAAIVGARGLRCVAVPVGEGLHLKSNVNAIDADTLVLTARFAAHGAFEGFARVVTAPGEEYAANVLAVNGRLFVPSGHPETTRRLRDHGAAVVELDTSEFRKMDGGLTCLSLRF